MPPTEYSLNLDAKLGKSTDVETMPNIEKLRRSPEKINAGVEVSTRSRVKIQSVFDGFGKPLAESIYGNKGFPINVAMGGGSMNYSPKGTQSATGGVFPDFGYGDRQLQYAVRDQEWVENQLKQEVDNLSAIRDDFRRWDLEYSTRTIKQNEFYEKNNPIYEAGWNLMNQGVVDNFSDKNGYNFLQKKSGIILSPEEERLIDKAISEYNTAQSEAQKINMYVSEAWNTRNNLYQAQNGQINYIQYVRDSLSVADQQKNDTERMRYRYLMWDVDFDKKVSASQEAFKQIYRKEFGKEEISTYYGNAMDSLGMLMTRIQAGSVITEADYKKEIAIIGKSLSDTEKLIFLGMIGANLNKLTYNWDMAKSGKLSRVKPFESMQSLAKAFQTGEPVPAGVCSSIHVAVASIAESWGTPAGTLSVSNGGVGHVVAIMNIGGKKVLSDYGKIYTANTMEELIDTYAIANKGVAVRNYVTDSSGKIIGHIDTPLTKAFRREVLSETILSDYISNGKLPEDGVNISLYSDRRTLRGQYTLENGVYLRGKYSEATLIPRVKSETMALSIGKKWKDLDFGGGWKGDAYIEGSMSRSRLSFDGKRDSQTTNTVEFQSGIRGEKNLGDGDLVYAGIGTNMRAQGSKPKTGDYATIGPIGTGTSAESSLTATIGGTWQASSDTRFSGEISGTRYIGPNIQSLSRKDLNPLRSGYVDKKIKVGSETKVGNGIVSGKVEYMNGSLSNEVSTGVGYSNNSIGVSVEQIKIMPKSVFAPTAQEIIRANIEGNITKDGSGKWFAGVEKGGIGGTQAKVGAKWSF